MKWFFIIMLLFGAARTSEGQNQDMQKRLDRYFLKVKKESPAPGFSVVVVKGKNVIFSKGYGVEVAGCTRPMTENSSTGIGSLTKSFTAMAMMQLVEQGKVRLDDPVTRYLPEFRTANKERSDKITVRMLLNNTSGLYGGVSLKWQDTETAMEKFMKFLKSVYLKKEPGSSYEYSNTGFSIAGLIISRVSGISYPEYMKKFIFQPLKMKRTTTNPAEFESLHVLYGHHMGIESCLPAGRSIESAEMIAAGSMLRSTATDLGHYLVALLNRGKYEGRQIIMPESIQSMWTGEINFPGLNNNLGGDDQDFHYGLGWMISEVEGRTIIHHGGSTGTMSSMTMLCPEKQLAASILFNIDYNYLNRYNFSSEFNILNNIFYLIENEVTTDFGNPRVPDPTWNDYKLPDSLKQRFAGNYRFGGIGDERNYQGVSLKIFTGPSGNLEGQMKRGKTEISNFMLDFANEVTAVSRNIGATKSIRFKVRLDGSVSGLVYSGSEFQKLKPDFLEHYQLLMTGMWPFSFYFLKSWQWHMQGNQLLATNEGDPGIVLVADLKDAKSTQLSQLLQEVVPWNKIIFEGAEMTEVRGTDFWREKSFVTVKGKRNFQHFVLVNDVQDFYLVLTTPSGALTGQIQNTISILVETFSVSGELADLCE